MKQHLLNLKITVTVVISGQEIYFKEINILDEYFSIGRFNEQCPQ